MPPTISVKPATKPTMTVKPYNIVDTGVNDAEINMYGEVVDSRPVDWWTGETDNGEYIVVDEFLSDLAELNTRDTITIHINSVGGSLYGGLAIYNRLKNMTPRIITVIDALAASAGGLIFQAGSTRKVNSASNMMIHAASAFIFGDYNSRELKDITKQLDAGTKAAVNALAESSGNSPEMVRAWVERETWYTGQEIIDAGFADEMVEENNAPAISLSADKAFFIVNGFKLSCVGMKNIPANIPVMAADVPDTMVDTGETRRDNNKNTGGLFMDITTIDALRAEFPELTAQIESAALEAGAAAERERIRGIDEIRSAVRDDRLIRDAMYGDTPMTAEQLALRAMREQAAIGDLTLNQLNSDTSASGANSVGAVPNGADPIEDEKIDEKAAVDSVVNLYNTLHSKNKQEV